MRIAVSQRADEVSSHKERRDALDQRWAQRIEPLGLLPVPVPNGLQDPQAWARALSIEGLLLTGGNDLSGRAAGGGSASERDRTEGLLLDLSQAMRWPVLGVCRGMQMLNGHLGGRLTAVQGHVATRHRLQRSDQPARFLADLADGLEVNSFHHFGIAPEGLAAALVPVLRDDEGFVEAAEHSQLPWAGIMWHPERESELAAIDRILLSQIFSSP